EPRIHALRGHLDKLVETGVLADAPTIRLTLSPLAIWSASWTADDYVAVARFLDSFAVDNGCEFVGGISKISAQHNATDPRAFLDALPTMLRETDRLCGFVQVGSTQEGLNIDLLNSAAEVVHKIARAQDEKSREAAARFCIACNVASN